MKKIFPLMAKLTLQRCAERWTCSIDIHRAKATCRLYHLVFLFPYSFQASPHLSTSMYDVTLQKSTTAMLTREVWNEPVRLYPACHKWRHSSYKYWVSKCAHIYTYCTKSGQGKGKMVGENPCPIIYHSINKYEVRKTLNIHSPEFPICALIHQIFLFVH